MNSRKINQGQNTSPRVLRDFSGGAPTPKKRKQKRNATGAPLFGFLFVVLFQALLLWLAVSVLRSASVIEWQLSAWHCLSLSVLFLLWRSLYSLVFARMDSQNAQ